MPKIDWVRAPDHKVWDGSLRECWMIARTTHGIVKQPYGGWGIIDDGLQVMVQLTKRKAQSRATRDWRKRGMKVTQDAAPER